MHDLNAGNGEKQRSDSMQEVESAINCVLHALTEF
jgi:hypothetical protein